MPTPKIDVLTVKLTVHIPLDAANAETVVEAYKQAGQLLTFCSGEERCVGSYNQRLNRVPAWEPEATADPLDIPPGLRRTSDTETTRRTL